MKRFLPLLLLLLVAGCEPAWSFAVFGDSSPAGKDDPPSPILCTAVERINESPAQLALFTGDLIRGRTLVAADTRRQFAQAHGALTRLRPRLLIVPGNHDVDGAQGAALFAERFGAAPWVVTHRGWTFLGLSSEEPGRHGALSAGQHQWLTAELARRATKDRTVIVIHRPIRPTLNPEHRLHSLPQPDLHRLFVEQGVTAVFSGHEHHYHREMRDGVLYVITGGAGAALLPEARHHIVMAHTRGKRLIVQPLYLP